MSKCFTLFLLLNLAASGAQAKKFIDGYIVMPNNDTMRCKIRLENPFKDRFDMYQRVIVKDDHGRNKTYLAKKKEIKGFGFVYKNKPQNYILRTEDNNILFEYKDITGPRLNLYSYCILNHIGDGGPARVEVLIMESRTLDILRINTGIFSIYRKRIRDFLYNDPDLIVLFDGTVNRFSDIRNFVMQANEYKQ